MSGEVYLYCLCGQKMRVMPEAASRPGKCVSCHQKFWTPQIGEFPPDISELRLDDCPGLLRQPGERVRIPASEAPPETAGGAPAPASGVFGAGEGPPGAGMGAPEIPASQHPLDTLESLRRIAAFEHILERQLGAGDDGRGDSARQPDRSTLESYRRLAATAREKLNREMKDALFETGERLMASLEEIARATLKFRVGETPYDVFYSQITRIRARREALERRRHNLRGWICAGDAHTLGGLADVTLDDFEPDGWELQLPPLEDEARPLVQLHVEELRDAFEYQAISARKAGEWRRMAREAGLPAGAVREGLLGAEADLKRAAARAAFHRERLAEVVRDCESDLGAVRARLQLEAERGSGPAADAEDMEEVLVQAQDDLRRLRQWARAALGANTAVDLPDGRPTVFRRLASPGALAEVAAESLPVYAASLLLLLLSVPLLMPAAPDGAFRPSVPAAFAALSGAFLLAVVPALRERLWRGGLLAGAAAAQGLLWGLDWGFSRGPVSGGAGPFWVAAAVGGLAATALACVMTFQALPRHRWVPPAAGLFAVLFLAAGFGAGVFFAGGGPPAAEAWAATPAENPVHTAPTEEMPPQQPGEDISIGSGALLSVEDAAGEAGEDSGEPAPPAAESLPQDVAVEPVLPPAPVTEALLRGVIQKEGVPPRFRMTVTSPSGRTANRDVLLGDRVHGEWRAAEYNSSSKKLTLSDGTQMLVLQAGESVGLP